MFDIRPRGQSESNSPHKTAILEKILSKKRGEYTNVLSVASRSFSIKWLNY